MKDGSKGELGLFEAPSKGTYGFSVDEILFW
jgi:hypothetical protein